MREAAKQVHTWLHTVGIDCPDQHRFIEGYVGAIQDAGIPVERFFSAATVLHPLIAGRAWKWMDGIITDFQWSRIEMKEYEEKTKSDRDLIEGTLASI